jgi:DNA-binding NarL/FixJ family response regulator
VLPRPPVAVTEKRMQTIRPTSERLRVMIVDDDDMLLRSIARSLRDRFECIPVNSVAAALSSLARDDRIDVLVADIIMPGENGYDLYEHLLRDRPHVASRTIFFSGGVRSDVLQTAIERTGRPLLGKPVDLQEFVRTVRDVAA